MRPEDFISSPADDDTPIANKLIEDGLAHMPDEQSRLVFLQATIHICFEYLAREGGRSYATGFADGMAAFIRNAKPTNPWPE